MQANSNKNIIKKKKDYTIFPYALLNSVILLFAIAISRCILIFSFKSARKLSKQSFFSCKQLLYIEYFAIRRA